MSVHGTRRRSNRGEERKKKEKKPLFLTPVAHFPSPAMRGVRALENRGTRDSCPSPSLSRIRYITRVGSRAEYVLWYRYDYDE